MGGSTREGALIGRSTARWFARFVVLALLFVAAAVAADDPDHPAPSAQSNKKLAETAAAEMLAQVQLPPGAVQSAGRPAGTAEVLVDYPPFAYTVVEQVAWWVLPGTAEEAIDWFLAHPPSGSELRGTGETVSSESPIPALIVDFSWPGIPGRLEKREVRFEVADRRGGGAVLLVDAGAEWTIPHPQSAQIPRQARVLEVEATDPGGRNPRHYTVTEKDSIRDIAQAIADLPARQPRDVGCRRGKESPAAVRLTFRRTRRGPVLAAANQAWPPGYCRFFKLRVRGTRQLPLSKGDRVVAAVERAVRAESTTSQGRSHRTVLLDEGMVGPYRWAVGVSGSGGKNGWRRPCVAMRSDDTTANGENDFESESEICGSLSLTEPSIDSEYLDEGGKDAATVYALVFVPRVKTLRAEFESRGKRRIPLRMLGKAQRRIAGVRPLRFAAFAFKGTECMQRLAGYDAAGKVVFLDDEGDCG